MDVAKASNKDQEMVDATIYLASLASEVRVIDPILDRVRGVTARWQPGQSLDAEGRDELLKAQNDIKHYLVKQDPLRRFTEASIQQQLEARFTPETSIFQRRPTLQLISVWLFAALLYPLGFALPFVDTFAARAQLAVPLFSMGLHLGMAWFYVSSFRYFTRALRRAYGYVVAGILVTGLGISNFPVVQILDLGKYALFRYDGLVILFGIASLLLYVGVWSFARLLGVRSVLASNWFLVLISTALVVISILTGYLLGRSDQIYFDLSFLGTIATAVYCGIGAMLAGLITSEVTAQYSRGLRWLAACLLFVAIGSTMASVSLIMLPDLHGLGPAYMMAPFMISELLMLQAGYTFKKDVTK